MPVVLVILCGMALCHFKKTSIEPISQAALYLFSPALVLLGMANTDLPLESMAKIVAFGGAPYGDHVRHREGDRHRFAVGQQRPKQRTAGGPGDERRQPLAAHSVARLRRRWLGPSAGPLCRHRTGGSYFGRLHRSERAARSWSGAEGHVAAAHRLCGCRWACTKPASCWASVSYAQCNTALGQRGLPRDVVGVGRQPDENTGALSSGARLQWRSSCGSGLGWPWDMACSFFWAWMNSPATRC